jgi:membrane protease YdiL (CAAX protease family)
LQTCRSQFLILATLFQGGLAIVALALAWLLQINPFDHFEWSYRAVGMGAAGTVPPLFLFVLTYRIPIRAFQQIKSFLIDVLGPYLSDCRWYDLAWIALLTGFSEELLFRAVLQTWLNQWGTIPSLLLSNLLFGLAHAVTALYSVLAGSIGIYLGALYQFAGDGNLLVPALTHGLYDFVAFLVVRNSFQAQQNTARSAPNA